MKIRMENRIENLFVSSYVIVVFKILYVSRIKKSEWTGVTSVLIKIYEHEIKNDKEKRNINRNIHFMKDSQ